MNRTAQRLLKVEYAFQPSVHVCLDPLFLQVLLDWCTHALTGWYNQKVEFSQNVLDSLWCYLDDLLHSRKLHTPLKQGKTTSLRLNMAQVCLRKTVTSLKIKIFCVFQK